MEIPNEFALVKRNKLTRNEILDSSQDEVNLRKTQGAILLSIIALLAFSTLLIILLVPVALAVLQSDKPIQPKKAKFEETQKLKKIITKTVNKAMEDEIRAKALEKPKLSKAQQVVAEYNQGKKL